jgi:hypothetical protein
VSLSDEISHVTGVREIEQRLQKSLFIVGSLKEDKTLSSDQKTGENQDKISLHLQHGFLLQLLEKVPIVA